MIFEYPRKLKIMEYDTWSHHHSGWKYCVENIEQTLSNTNGICFFPNQIYKIIYGQKVNEPWTGVIHTTPTCLKNMEPAIIESNWCANCIGLFVFSEHTASYVRKYTDKPVCVLTHPIKFTDRLFDPAKANKRILFIGGWLRDPTSFERLNTEYSRVLVRCPGIGLNYSGKLDTIDYMQNEEYENALQTNIVYLDFIDTTTNNTLLECIVRNTPICVRKHPSIVEHLGADYPLYFDDVNEASEKLTEDTIEKAHLFIKNMDKSKFAVSNFIKQIACSSIYKSIKCRSD